MLQEPIQPLDLSVLILSRLNAVAIDCANGGKKRRLLAGWCPGAAASVKLAQGGKGQGPVMGGGQPKGRRRQKTLGRRLLAWKSGKKNTTKIEEEQRREGIFFFFLE